MIRLAALFILISTAALADQPSMSPAAWTFQYSPGMPAHPVKAGVGWGFAFPAYNGPLPCRNDQACPGAHYLTTNSPSLAGAKSLLMTGSVTLSKGASFNYRTEPSNNGGGLPAGFRFLIHAQGDDCLCHEYGRWWSTDSVPLKRGPFVLKAPLVPSHWSSVFGKKATANGRALAGWRSAVAHPARIGITFGGGNFYGHGVNVRNGRATMTVASVKVKR